jgi:hypothetical protein
MDDTTNSNWRSMFEQGRSPGRGIGRDGSNAPPLPEPDDPDMGGPPLDLTDYKPWVLQRGRGRPALMLDLRRFAEKSGLWIGWQVSYPHLIAVEYVGDRMLSLDFGLRQFMIEGQGLQEMARHLQQGTVLALQEYSRAIWPQRREGPMIASIKRIGADPQTML